MIEPGENHPNGQETCGCTVPVENGIGGCSGPRGWFFGAPTMRFSCSIGWGGAILGGGGVEWSNFGGSGGIPGGARCEHESSISAALREAEEEAGVRGEHVRVRSTSVLDLGFWSYTTVIADATVRFFPCVRDGESIELRWISIERVIDFPLHPRFADAWPALLRRVRAIGPLESD